MTHISTRDELDLLVNFAEVKRGTSVDVPKVTVKELLTLREWLSETVKLDSNIKRCLVEFADQTRHHPLALQGVSTRSLVLAMPALQAWALVQGRQYVAPVDVESLAHAYFCTPFNDGGSIGLCDGCGC